MLNKSILRLILQQNYKSFPNRGLIIRSAHNQLVKDHQDQFDQVSGSEFPVSSPEAEHYDIIINGGGIVGFSLYAALKASPYLSSKRVLLIEQQAQPKLISGQEDGDQRRQFSNRVSSITLASKQLFQQLEIWHEHLQPYAKKVSGMYVWSDHYQNGINFRGQDGDGELCYIIENNRILEALHKRIMDMESSGGDQQQKIYYKTSVVDIIRDVHPLNPANQREEIHLKLIDLNNPDGNQLTKNIRTNLLIGCDGFKSIVRSKSNLPYFEVDLEQMGIVATLEVECSLPKNQIAFQRFLDNDSVIALLPLDDNYSSLVLSVPKTRLQEWMSLSDEDFVQRLQNELIRETRIQTPLDKLASTFNLSQLYGQIQIRSPPILRSIIPKSRAAFPLGFGTTVPFLVGSIQAKVPLLQALANKEKRVNMAIIGDAAHRIHPLAGQGLNLGLGDAACLAQCLEQKLKAGYELFASTNDSMEALSQTLYEFERNRVLKLVPMLTAIHSMQTMFKYTPSAVLSVVNQLDLAKQLIVSFANSP